MSVYSKNGNALNHVYRKDGSELAHAYDKSGNVIFSSDIPEPDYSKYSYIQKWASKGVNNTQGFDIYGGKVYWISKSGDSSIPANCYVWDLVDGSQAFASQPITIYSGHGNSLDIVYPKAYAGTAYSPATAYENMLSSDGQAFTLSKKLDLSEDSTYGHDVCVDEDDTSILWSLAHTGAIGTDAPYKLSKWNLTELTDNGDGTHSPRLIKSVTTPKPSAEYFQGMTMHDGLIWYASGYAGTSTDAYVYAVNPATGAVVYTIDCDTTAEPEGVAWVPDSEAVGGYAMYVGFQGMMLRKYTFDALS